MNTAAETMIAIASFMMILCNTKLPTTPENIISSPTHKPFVCFFSDLAQIDNANNGHVKDPYKVAFSFTVSSTATTASGTSISPIPSPSPSYWDENNS